MRALERAGWVVQRVRGSHHRLIGPDGQRVTVPVHGAKTLPVDTIKSIIDQSGMTVEEFVQLG